MKKLLIFSLSVAGILLTSSLPSIAGTTVSIIPGPESEAATDGWKFNVAPYGWLTAMTGDMRIGTTNVPVDVSFKDTLDTVDMGFMAAFGASRGKWSIGTDFVYARFSQRVPGDGVTVNDIGVVQKQWLISPAVAYRVLEEENWNLSVLAGARVTRLEGTINQNLTNGGTDTVSQNKTWVDPIIGIKGKVDISDRVNFTYLGTIGGFGVSSDLVWAAFGGFGYHFNDTISGILGYRALGVDYDKGNLAVDTTTHGPVIGVSFKF